MSTPTFVGIKNVAGKAHKVTYGGSTSTYEKDEIRVVDAATADFLIKRTVYGSEKNKAGQTQATVKTLFKVIPLVEALKVAKEPKNPSIVAARAEAEKEEDMEKRILEKLKESGWEAPKSKEEKAKEAAELLEELKKAGWKAPK